MHVKPRSAIATALVVSLLCSPAFGGGHNKLNPDAKYRHDVMEAMASHFAALAAIFTGRVDRPGQLQAHAEALAMTAAMTGSLFPAGSEGGAALPLAFEEPEGIQRGADNIAAATAALAAAAASGDKGAIAKAFKEAGDGCKGCHDRYKAEDE
jgi:cytochrome c556